LKAEQDFAHIDELLKFESGRKIKMSRKARHQMTDQLEKAERKTAKVLRNSKQRRLGSGKRKASQQ
jgi:16S rRNA U1498 N3-methylase RsmE